MVQCSKLPFKWFKGSFSAKLRKRQSRALCAREQFKRFKVLNATAPQFNVLSPLSYESGRAERKSAKARFYTPEGHYTRRMSLYTSQRLLTRPKGNTRDDCRLTRRSAAIMK